MKEPDIRDLERLVEEAWRVFRNREGNERQKLGETIAAATVAALRKQEESFRGRRRGGKVMRLPFRAEQCAYCKEIGHWKRECPKRQEENKLLMATKQ